MSTTTILTQELSQIIRDATAPAFLLGALVGLISLLIVRLNRIADHVRNLKASSNNDSNRKAINASLVEMTRRAKMVGRALMFAVISGVCSACLVLVSFFSAIVGIDHNYSALLLFTVAMLAFAISVIFLWFELRIALKEIAALN